MSANSPSTPAPSTVGTYIAEVDRLIQRLHDELANLEQLQMRGFWIWNSV